MLSNWTMRANPRPDLNVTALQLQQEGYQVSRYQMASNPQAFLGNAEVMRLVHEKEMAALPIVVVRGEIVAEGKYPGILEILGKLNDGKSARFAHKAANLAEASDKCFPFLEHR